MDQPPIYCLVKRVAAPPLACPCEVATMASTLTKGFSFNKPHIFYVITNGFVLKPDERHLELSPHY